MLLIECTSVCWAEKAWTLEVLLETCLGVPFRMQANEGLDGYRFTLPNGKTFTFEDHFFKNNNHYLETHFLPKVVFFSKKTDTVGLYGRDHLESTPEGLYCGIDLVASAFFMLSRWEEFVVTERDAHGRFPANASIAVKYGFLNRPVVDEYASLIRHFLLQLGWNEPFPAKTFTVVPTHDVDHPLLWWKPMDRLRTLAGSFRREHPLEEIRWWFRQSHDPYDSFDELMDLSEKNGWASRFNFMGLRPKSSDAWYPLDHPFVTSLIKRIRERGHFIGFHPSYEAFEDENLFKNELQSIRDVSDEAVFTGRQHYLRFAVPETWNRWQNAGMQTDSSMGYAEIPGFRCGICRSFPVFDVLKRKRLDLLEQPLLFMDVSLALYQKTSVKEALKQAMALRANVEKHGGEWVVLWHNSSWNTPFWEPWKAVYKEIIKNTT
ncbi:MAG: polysaccharide deacetylase family protein [Saprospiraceae bacterium]|nr:polysaccharide deacetylase family protein [Saprospiraceae bacterium]